MTPQSYFKLFLLILLFAISSKISNAQSIVSTDNLPYAVWRHESEVLPNGNIIIFGGNDGVYDNSTGYTSSQIYDVASGTWSAGASMSEIRARFASVVLNDGSILAIGGLDDQTEISTNTVERYDPTNGTWSYVSPMIHACFGHNAIKLKDGRVLVVGDVYNPAVGQIYDPSKDEWSITSEIGTNIYQGSSMVLLQDGNVLLTGGYYTETRSFIYNATSGAWREIEDRLFYGRNYHSSTLLKDGKVVIIGGIYSQNRCEVFDPATEIFTRENNLDETRVYDEAVLLANGEVLVYGLGDFLNLNKKTIEVFQPPWGSWYALESYPDPGAHGYQINDIGNGTYLVAGGYNTYLDFATSAAKLISVPEDVTCSSISLTSEVSGSTSICYGKDVSIQVNNTDASWTYQAYIGSYSVSNEVNGGGNISINIPYDNLGIDNNLIKIRTSKAGCNSRYISDTTLVKVSITNVSSTTISISDSLILCTDSTTTLTSIVVANSYVWSNGSTTQQIDVGEQGNYFVRLKDVSGCISEPSDTISISEFAFADSLSFNSDTAYCNDAIPFQLDIVPTNGTWSGNGVTSTGLFDPTSLTPGTVELIYTYCNLTDTFLISIDSVPEMPTLSIAYDDSLCKGYPQYLTVNDVPASLCTSYDLNGVTKSNLCNTGEQKFYVAGQQESYELTIRSTYTGSSGCTATSIVTDSVIVFGPPPSISAFAVKDTICREDTAIIGIAGSKIGGFYYIEDDHVVEGNDDTIYIKLSKPYYSGYQFKIYGGSTIGCFGTMAYQKVYTDNINVEFEIATTNYIVGDTVAITNNSNSNTHIWTINDSVYTSQAPQYIPADIIYGAKGAKEISLLGISTKGCIDSAFASLILHDSIGDAPYAACSFDRLESYMAMEFRKKEVFHVDKNKNTYFAGYYYMGGSGAKYAGSYGLFLMKFDPDGNLLWEERQGDNKTSFYISSINDLDVDDDGNVYVTGNFRSFDQITLGNLNIGSSADYSSGFVVKFNADGEAQWKIISYGSDDYDSGFSDILIDDESGKIYTVASRPRGVKFSDGTYISYANYPFVVMEIDKFGNLVNEYNPGVLPFSYSSIFYGIYNPSPSSYVTGRVTFASPYLHLQDDKIIVTGGFKGTVRIGAFTLQSTYGAAFMAVIDLVNGFEKAEKLFGAHRSHPMASIDDEGNFYFAHHFGYDTNNPDGTGDIVELSDQDTLVFSIDGNKTSGGFIVKYDKDGNYVGNIKQTNYFPTDIKCVGDQVLVYGYYTDFLGSYEGSPSTTQVGIHSKGGQDIVLMSVSKDLEINWMETIGGDEADKSFEMVVSKCGKDVYLGGESSRGNEYSTPSYFKDDSLVVFATAQQFSIRYNIDGDCTSICPDCNNVDNGTAYMDSCNICVGGNTGNDACVEDCNGDWGGTVNMDSSDVVVSSCGDYISPYGNTYPITGIYVDTVVVSAGCSSKITTNLTVNESSISDTSAVLCGNFSWHGTTYTATTTTTQILTNSAGCDSVVTLNLTINNADTSVADISGTLVSLASNASFRWLDCNNNFSVLVDDTLSMFAPPEGDYAIEVSQNGCIDTSSCYSINLTGLFEHGFGNDIKVYPIPTRGNFTIDLGTDYEHVNVSVVDMLGERVFNEHFYNRRTINIDLNTASGTYILTITNKDSVVSYRVVVIK